MVDIEIYLQHVENKDKMKNELQELDRVINTMINEVNVSIGKELYEFALDLFDPACKNRYSDIVKGSHYGSYYRRGNVHTITYSCNIGKYFFKLLKEDKHATNGRFKHELNLVTVYDVTEKTYNFCVETYNWNASSILSNKILEESLNEMFWHHMPGNKHEKIQLSEVKEQIKQAKELLDNYHTFFLTYKLTAEN